RPDGGWTDDALHDGRRSRGPRDADEPRSWFVRSRRGQRRHAWRQPLGRQLTFGPARLRPTRRPAFQRVREEKRYGWHTRGRYPFGYRRNAGSVCANAGAESFRGPGKIAGTDAELRRHHAYGARPEARH